MDEHGDVEEGGFEPTSIGVGMGGSCPNCRAPVDLGQEFCLECGAPIRFSPRTRRPQRRPGGAVTTTTSTPPPGASGFPWIPFLVVLALIGGGLVLALVGGDDGAKSKASGSTES
ncbi:MAG: hypothetical protein JWM86_178, partial [Thermoleophilia bacterium]|nr:hypothetical protein [Thermoleophilia bacterium]